MSSTRRRLPSSEPAPTRVRVDVPPWIWGNNISGFLQAADLRRSKADSAEIQTVEAYERRTPALVESGPVVSISGKAQGSAEWLARFDDSAIEAPVYAKVKDHPYFTPPETSNPLVDLVEWSKRAAMFTPGVHLLDQAKEIHVALHNATFNDSDEKVFPGASILAVRRSESLVYRVKLSAVLLRASYDERLRSGDATLLKEWSADGALVFGAGNGLTTGVMMLDAYLLPLMAALTPHVWGFPILRIHGTLVCSFGRAVSGIAQSPSGLLDTLYLPGRHDKVDVLQFDDPNAPDAALHWWSAGLNRMFGVITDPVTFADTSGKLDINLAFQTLLTVEQIFRRIGSSQMADGDLFGRRAAMFSAIDALEGLTGYSPQLMLSPEHASKTLARVETAVSASAAEILLPSARRAVAALEDVATGFYSRNRDGTIPVGSGREPLDPRVAAAKYMYLLRNSTHGFSGKQALAGDGAGLLAAHTGDVHHDVGLLGWLYLLDMLAQPNRLRQMLSKRARRRP